MPTDNLTLTLQNKTSLQQQDSMISLRGNLAVDLAVSRLSKTFGGQEKNQVLQDINFSVPQGQALALIGHNGSGKSTLLRCCLRLIEPSSGKIDLLGTDITKLPKRELQEIRSRVGFIFQGHNLVRRLSVLSNVIHGAQSRKSGFTLWYHSFASRSDREEAMTWHNYAEASTVILGIFIMLVGVEQAGSRIRKSILSVGGES